MEPERTGGRDGLEGDWERSRGMENKHKMQEAIQYGSGSESSAVTSFTKATQGHTGLS
jgi:hypothetical protein